MITAGSQNFDLLGLGGNQPIVGGPQLPSPLQAAGTPAFGNILDLLLGATTSPATPFMTGAPTAEDPIPGQFNDALNQLTADIQAAAAMAASLPSFAPETTGAAVTDQASTATDIPSPDSTASAPIVELLPNISASNVRALLQQTATAPAAGAYSVLSSQLKNDTVEFTVQPDQDKSKTMVLTLPVSTLKDVSSLLSMNGSQGISGSRGSVLGQPMRVSLGESIETSRTVDSVLSKLNVREIIIDAGSTAAQGQSTKPEIAVTLMGEFQATPVQLKLQADPRQLRLKNASSTSEADLLSEPVPAAKESNLTSQAVTAISENRAADQNLDRTTRLTREFALPKKVELALVKSDLANSAMAVTTDSGTKLTTTVENLLPAQQVKFTLPDLSAKSMLETGRSVTIKIEPDYLGPARLHLSINNDALTARVTVDSTQAKAAIEGSLDRLTDQLNKAGVTVNRIEVSLSNNGAGQQSADHQANWYRPTRLPFMGLNESMVLTSQTLTPNSGQQSRQYLYARGVNVYA